METAAAAPWPVLAGPTAVGKTAVAIRLALRLQAEIVSVDSRQVYRGLEIGSAAPLPGELAAVPHHLIGFRDPKDEINAGEYGRLARETIAEIQGRGRRALLVGGSGLYLRAALGGLDELPRDAELRARLHARAETEGVHALHEELAARDPETAAALFPRDAHRVLRALEIMELTGRPASELRTRGRRTTTPARVVILHREPAALETRIRQRVAAMIADGLEPETVALLARGVAADGMVLSSVGYAETVAMLEGRLDRADWPETIVVNTRRFAKRQRTWFRGMKDAAWLTVLPGETSEAVAARAAELFLEAG